MFCRVGVIIFAGQVGLLLPPFPLETWCLWPYGSPEDVQTVFVVFSDSNERSGCIDSAKTSSPSLSSSDAEFFISLSSCESFLGQFSGVGWGHMLAACHYKFSMIVFPLARVWQKLQVTAMKSHEKLMKKHKKKLWVAILIILFANPLSWGVRGAKWWLEPSEPYRRSHFWCSHQSNDRSPAATVLGHNSPGS